MIFSHRFALSTGVVRGCDGGAGEKRCKWEEKKAFYK